MFFIYIPFDDRPGKLFDGLQHCRSVIFISHQARQLVAQNIFAAKYQRWNSEIRSGLFNTLEYAFLNNESFFTDSFPKYANEIAARIFEKLKNVLHRSIGFNLAQSETKHFIFYQEATQYWVKAVVGLPYYAKNGVVSAPAHGGYIFFKDELAAQVACAIMNSSLFYMYFIAFGDCFHLRVN